jgi:hypothetical protein
MCRVVGDQKSLPVSRADDIVRTLHERVVNCCNVFKYTCSDGAHPEDLDAWVGEVHLLPRHALQRRTLVNEIDKQFRRGSRRGDDIHPMGVEAPGVGEAGQGKLAYGARNGVENPYEVLCRAAGGIQAV